MITGPDTKSARSQPALEDGAVSAVPPERPGGPAELRAMREELVRARNEAREIARRFELLKGISEAALADGEPALALGDVLQRVRQGLPAHCVTLLLRDQDSDLLRVRASVGDGGIGTDIAIRFRQRLSGRAAAEGRSLAVDDVSAAERGEPLLRAQAGSAGNPDGSPGRPQRGRSHGRRRWRW